MVLCLSWNRYLVRIDSCLVVIVRLNLSRSLCSSRPTYTQTLHVLHIRFGSVFTLERERERERYAPVLFFTGIPLSFRKSLCGVWLLWSLFVYIISFEDPLKKRKKGKKEKKRKKEKRGAIHCASPLFPVVCCDLLCAQARVSSTV